MLLRLLVIRDLAQHRVRTVLTIVGVALGVSIYVAMRTANVEIIRSFEESAASVTGRAALQITAGEDGFDETLIVPVRNTAGVLAVTPVLEISAALLSPEDVVLESLLIVGVDVLDQAQFWGYAGDFEGRSIEDVLAPDAIMVPLAFLRRHNLAIGSHVNLLVDTETRTVTVRGVMNDSPERGSSRSHVDGLAVMDIASAQYTFDRLGGGSFGELRPSWHV